MNHAKQAQRFNQASSFFFIIAFFLAKARYIPSGLAALILDALSLSLYFIGYSLWGISAVLSPGAKAKKRPVWRNLSQNEYAYGAASFLGVIATIYSFVALVAPFMGIPGVWVYLVSNCFWVYSEYKKYQAIDKITDKAAADKQYYYLCYTGCVTGISLISAIGTTVVFCLPALASPVLAGSVILGVIIGIFALALWVNSCSIKTHSQMLSTYARMMFDLNTDEENDYRYSLGFKPEEELAEVVVSQVETTSQSTPASSPPPDFDGSLTSDDSLDKSFQFS